MDNEAHYQTPNEKAYEGIDMLTVTKDEVKQLDDISDMFSEQALEEVAPINTAYGESLDIATETDNQMMDYFTNFSSNAIESAEKSENKQLEQPTTQSMPNDVKGADEVKKEDYVSVTDDLDLNYEPDEKAANYYKYLEGVDSITDEEFRTDPNISKAGGIIADMMGDYASDAENYQTNIAVEAMVNIVGVNIETGRLGGLATIYYKAYNGTQKEKDATALMLLAHSKKEPVWDNVIKGVFYGMTDFTNLIGGKAFSSLQFLGKNATLKTMLHGLKAAAPKTAIGKGSQIGAGYATIDEAFRQGIAIESMLNDQNEIDKTKLGVSMGVGAVFGAGMVAVPQYVMKAFRDRKLNKDSANWFRDMYKRHQAAKAKTAELETPKVKLEAPAIKVQTEAPTIKVQTEAPKTSVTVEATPSSTDRFYNKVVNFDEKKRVQYEEAHTKAINELLTDYGIADGKVTVGHGRYAQQSNPNSVISIRTNIGTDGGNKEVTAILEDLVIGMNQDSGGAYTPKYNADGTGSNGTVGVSLDKKQFDTLSDSLEPSGIVAVEQDNGTRLDLLNFGDKTADEAEAIMVKALETNGITTDMVKFDIDSIYVEQANIKGKTDAGQSNSNQEQPKQQGVSTQGNNHSPRESFTAKVKAIREEFGDTTGLTDKQLQEKMRKAPKGSTEKKDLIEELKFRAEDKAKLGKKKVKPKVKPKAKEKNTIENSSNFYSKLQNEIDTVFDGGDKTFKDTDAFLKAMKLKGVTDSEVKNSSLAENLGSGEVTYADAKKAMALRNDNISKETYEPFITNDLVTSDANYTDLQEVNTYEGFDKSGEGKKLYNPKTKETEYVVHGYDDDGDNYARNDGLKIGTYDDAIEDFNIAKYGEESTDLKESDVEAFNGEYYLDLGEYFYDTATGNYHSTEQQATDAITTYFEGGGEYGQDFYAPHRIAHETSEHYRMNSYELPDFDPKGKYGHEEPHMQHMDVEAENIALHTRAEERTYDGKQGTVLFEAQSQWNKDVRAEKIKGESDTAENPYAQKQAEKIAVGDELLTAINSDKEWFGFSSGHYQNGERIEIQNKEGKNVHRENGRIYNESLPTIVSKIVGEMPYMADMKTGKPIGNKGKIYADPKIAESDVNYFDDMREGKDWMWKLDINDSMRAKLKNIKLTTYGVGGIMLINTVTGQEEEL